MIANPPQQKLFSELWYSFRRFYVDSFFSQNISLFSAQDKILDIGGKKNVKRGVFDIEQYPLVVEYVNIDANTNPDYLCDATAIPVQDTSYDGVILAEVLEHVPHPDKVLREAHRVLKKGGYLLLTTPFMFRVHADPYDYTRFTGYWYQEVLTGVGFKELQIHQHGTFPSVCGDLAKLWAYELQKAGKPRYRWVKTLFHAFVFWCAKKVFYLEKQSFFQHTQNLSSHTTGYGVVGIKK